MPSRQAVILRYTHFYHESHSALSYQISAKSDSPLLSYYYLTILNIKRRYASHPRDL